MQIFEKLIGILFDLSGLDNITPKHELQRDLGLDSLRLVTLLVMLEDEFEIILEEADMNPFDLITVSDVVHLVTKYISGGMYEKNS